MSALPVERRALGLVMREAEQRGMITAPLELRRIVATIGYTADQIDRAFQLLVTRDGRTVGGTAVLGEFDGRWIGRLVLADLVEMTDDGWALTPRGQLFSDLLDVYADPKHLWCPRGGAGTSGAAG